jgi:predicted MPP superfamily phosphohydrolase
LPDAIIVAPRPGCAYAVAVRRAFAILLGLAAIAAAVLAYAYAEARRLPVVRRATIALADWPDAAAPITTVLISDIHIGSSAMDAERLGRIVAQVDALHPNLVLIAGDFVFGHDPRAAGRNATALTGALRRLRPRLGTVAVLGNHDLWTGQAAVRAALEEAGVRVLQNEAVARGPLAIAGVADLFTHQADVGATWRRLRPLRGARIVLTHSPDLEQTLPAGTAPLLAGHTHCGQVVLPLIGVIDWVARLRFSCGLYRDKGRSVVVTGGLGTSGVPFRLGAPPDLWLLTLGPPGTRGR